MKPLLARGHLDLCWPLVPSLGGNLVPARRDRQRFEVEQGLLRPAEEARRLGGLEMAAGGGLGELRAVGRLECFRVDGSCEWVRCAFSAFCNDNNIGVEFTPPGAPQYNGVVKSAIWRIMTAMMAAVRRSTGRGFNADFAPPSPPALTSAVIVRTESAKRAANAIKR